MALQGAKATQEAAPGEYEQVVSVCILHTVTVDKQGNAQVLPTRLPSHGVTFQLVITSLSNTSPKVCKLAFSKAEQLREHLWVVGGNLRKHEVRQEEGCLFQSIFGCFRMCAWHFHSIRLSKLYIGAKMAHDLPVYVARLRSPIPTSGNGNQVCVVGAILECAVC